MKSSSGSETSGKVCQQIFADEMMSMCAKKLKLSAGKRSRARSSVFSNHVKFCAFRYIKSKCMFCFEVVYNLF